MRQQPCTSANHPAPNTRPLAEASSITAATDAAAAEYAAGKARLAELAASVRAAVQLPQHCLHFLRPGRIIRVAEGAWLAGCWGGGRAGRGSLE